MSGPAPETERRLAAARLLRRDPELQVAAAMNPDGEPPSEPPGLPADYRVGNT